MRTKTAPSKTTTFEALLGILSMGPMSGYQIKQRIDESIGNFWTESFGQIYPTLKKLEAEGLVSSSVDAGSGDRSSKTYSLTERGRRRLAAWLGIPTRPQVPRDELLLKLFFCDQAGVATAREHAVAAHTRGVADLAKYRTIAAEVKKLHAGHPGSPYWMFTLRYGVAQTKALIRWADETLAEMDKMQKKTGRKHHAK